MFPDGNNVIYIRNPDLSGVGRSQKKLPNLCLLGFNSSKEQIIFFLNPEVEVVRFRRDPRFAVAAFDGTEATLEEIFRLGIR